MRKLELVYIMILTVINVNAQSKKQILNIKEQIPELPDEKIKRFLIQELIKQGFVYNGEDNKVWFEHKKWESEFKKTYIIYYGILLLPVISGLLLIILRK